MLNRSLPFLLVLAGCPDPTAAPGGAGTDKPMEGQGGPPGGEGQPGTGGPPPGGEGQPGGGMGGRPTPQGFQVTAGQGVKLSGTLTYTEPAETPF